jgi:uncharacterized cofD-like protein
LAATLGAARRYASDIRAVVTVADDGGSSGRLTRELGIPPPGDIRNCLVALARNRELAELFQHRFDTGALTGHTVGNLVIAALTERTGDFAEAVAEAGRVLDCSGRVFPATTALVDLHARVEGKEIRGQVAVAQSREPIQAVFLAPPDPPACADAVTAIMDADQIVLGPGSLFTSLIATLLVPGIREALRNTTARKVLVCNSRMQKGETGGLDAASHVGAVLAQVGPDALDVVIVQSPEIESDPVVLDRDALEHYAVDVVEADVVRPSGNHEPERLAAVLSTL